jgi:hypothetical protein
MTQYHFTAAKSRSHVDRLGKNAWQAKSAFSVEEAIQQVLADSDSGDDDIDLGCDVEEQGISDNDNSDIDFEAEELPVGDNVAENDSESDQSVRSHIGLQSSGYVYLVIVCIRATV